MVEKGEIKIGKDVQDSTVILGDRNMVVQIVNSIYNRDELNKLVRESFKDLSDLQDFWGKNFLAVDPRLDITKGNKQKPPGYEEYIEHFKQNNEIVRLLVELKKRSPQEYRKFIASQVLEAIGLSADQIPDISPDKDPIKREFVDLQNTLPSQQFEDHADALEYEDREVFFYQIRHDRKNSHIVLHGSSGVGKSHFIRKFREKYKRDTCCVVIDLNACEPGDILATTIKQMTGKERVRGSFLELAQAIHATMDANPRINRFYFIFENADQKQAAIDFLFSSENIIHHPDLIRLLKSWKLYGNIQLNIMVLSRHIVSPTKSSPGYPHVMHVKITPLDSHSIQNMFDKIIEKRDDLPVNNDLTLIPDLSDKIFHLTGGHPKCAKQMMIALADQGCVRPTEAEWIQLYREHVIATIKEEMLSSMDLEMLSYVWPLSIFRRFDQRLLGGLIERKILPGVPENISRQAHDLRVKLEMMSLFDVDEEIDMISTNYAMRNSLSFHMLLDAPERYRMLNARALEIFLDRLQRSDTSADKQVERKAVNLLEILYHWTRLISMGNLAKKKQTTDRSAHRHIAIAFENYLLLALTLVPKDNRHDFLRSLKKKWTEDKELQETVRQATKRDDTVLAITNAIKKYDINSDGNE